MIKVLGNNRLRCLKLVSRSLKLRKVVTEVEISTFHFEWNLILLVWSYITVLYNFIAKYSMIK